MKFKIHIPSTNYTITDHEHNSQSVDEFIENYYGANKNFHYTGAAGAINLDMAEKTEMINP